LASLYRARLGVAHLSTGAIFRQEIARNTPLGRRVSRYVMKGRLVPDALVVEVMAAHLGAGTLASGFVLDGFPRTEGQAAGLDRVLRRRRRALDGAVYLTSPVPLLIRRLSGRRVCDRCGENYHVRTMRPRRPGRCDRCGGRLVVRRDDEPATIRRRLAIDRRAAAPLIRYYRRRRLLHRVNGAGRIGQVYARTLTLFRRNGWVDARDGRTAHDRAQERRRT
jgi:adenylate kinase